MIDKGLGEDEIETLIKAIPMELCLSYWSSRGFVYQSYSSVMFE